MKNQNFDFTITTIACAYVSFLAIRNMWKLITGNLVAQQLVVFLCSAALLAVSVALFIFTLRIHLKKRKAEQQQSDENESKLPAETDDAPERENDKEDDGHSSGD